MWIFPHLGLHRRRQSACTARPQADGGSIGETTVLPAFGESLNGKMKQTKRKKFQEKRGEYDSRHWKVAHTDTESTGEVVVSVNKARG